MNESKVKITHIITGICLLAIGALLYHFIAGAFDGFGTTSGQGTVFEFRSNGDWNNGFNREAIVYTEDGVTSITFSGNITTDATAEISLVTADGNAVFSRTFVAVNSQVINFDIVDLMPYAYYTLRFSSTDASSGHLVLTTEQSLVERPAIPKRPERRTP